MKKFTRFRTLEELRKACEKNQWKLETQGFEEGSDYIGIKWKVGKISGHILVNVVNGRFFGETDKNIWFSSDDTKFERRRWFNKLLNTVYVD